jgi:cyclopropane-fatty-acyl-phospholipid synthase
MPGFLSELDDWLLRRVQSRAGRASFRIDLESRAEPDCGPAILYRDRAALLRSILAGECGFGDAYASGSVRIVGELVSVLEQLYVSIREAQPRRWTDRCLQRLLLFLQHNSFRGARRNIHRHYDLGTSFYRLWLDAGLLYTCAYFEELKMSLEEAQQAKMELVCRKLRLRGGERVVEAGCGWGALALYMARRYGVTVRAYNISSDQVAFARNRALEEGMAGRVEFIEDDYRSITGTYDVFVSVGMLEHVGRSNYRDFGSIIHRCVGDSGRGLLHFIGRDHPEPLSAWINERIFPGAYAPSLSEAFPLLERWEYAVQDVDNLRLHYARTLECWLERFERAYPDVSRHFGDEFARAWRLYLAGSAAAFSTNSLQLYQVLFTGRACTTFNWSRKDLYRDSLETRCTAATL